MPDLAETMPWPSSTRRSSQSSWSEWSRCPKKRRSLTIRYEKVVATLNTQLEELREEIVSRTYLCPSS